MKINPRRLEMLLNRILNEYNIKVYVTELPSTKRQELKIAPELIKPVKYSPLFSQMYDERRVEIAERTGEFEANPKAKFGVKMKVLHWYHWALLNDVLTYLLDSLGAKYVIKTAVGTYSGWRAWRHQIDIDYYPQFDPAFNKRNTRVIKKFKGVPIYADRAKMLDAIDDVDIAVKAGTLKPVDIPELEEEILSITRAADYYAGITVPESLEEAKPHVRAWYRARYGEDADSKYHYASEEEKDREYNTLIEWLRRVDPDSDEFRAYLRIWKEEVKKDIAWAAREYGSYEEVLRDSDDAGFPYGLAKSLKTTPFKPEITRSDLNSLVETQKEEESVEA